MYNLTVLRVFCSHEMLRVYTRLNQTVNLLNVTRHERGAVGGREMWGVQATSHVFRLTN